MKGVSKVVGRETSHSENEFGERKTPRKRRWWWLLSEESKCHPCSLWEGGKESPERLCSEGGTLAKEEELPCRGTGLPTPSLILLHWMGVGGALMKGGSTWKTSYRILQTTSPSLSTSCRDTMMENCWTTYRMNTFETTMLETQRGVWIQHELIIWFIWKNNSWNVSSKWTHSGLNPFSVLKQNSPLGTCPFEGSEGLDTINQKGNSPVTLNLLRVD